jgi:hypothetical protein
MAGNATPIIAKMKKIADMSAIGVSPFVLVDVRDTGAELKKLQEKKTSQFSKNCEVLLIKPDRSYDDEF